MTRIPDEAIDAGAEAIYSRDLEYDYPNEEMSELVLTAAAPHLRAGIAEELLDDTPGSPLTRGYQRLMAPKRGEHPVRTWEAAVRVMLDTLLEGGGE